MDKLNNILTELGISKVKLSKYLGVSRQMVYNYLELDSISKWPKEKKLLLFKLLDIEDGEEETLDKIKINTEYLEAVEARLNNTNKSAIPDLLDIKGLSKDEQTLLSDFTFALKEKFVNEDDSNREENYNIILYLYHFLQSLENVEELKYLLGYVSKMTGFTKALDFKLDEAKQYRFEAILYSAFNLYNSGEASPDRIKKYHKKFEDEIDARSEEKLGRTQQLNFIKIQALRELGYNEITPANAAEFLEKMAEIESRKF